MMPLALIALILMMVVPVPPTMLDVFFTFNIVLGLVILMVSLNTYRPLDFSSFPTILLFATILRLALNVASTRVVLTDGHKGTDAAGQVIKSFGEFIIGGNFVIGILVFLILIIINLAVIVKGTGRVSEVSARFTLDAMPGKQMAIDAELNAGLLTPEEAKRRREEVSREADFYGSMDGATKFVKGDAIAGLLILAINIIGGLIIGMMKYNMSLGKAAQIYITLTIGDGLVAQIPSLLLSLATAIIVTRDSSAHDLTDRMILQMGGGRAWYPVAGIIALFGIIPGMPMMLFLAAGGLAAAAGWYGNKLQANAAASATAEAAAVEGDAEESDDKLSLEDVSMRAPLMLEVGYGLIPLVEDDGKSALVARITGIRKQASRDLGFIIPAVRIRDNLSLQPNAYRITIAGVIVAEDEIVTGKMLAIQGGSSNVVLPGEQVKDPTFGLDAVWIDKNDRARAQASGYTVVDPSTVIATHLNQLLLRHASDLLGQDDVQALLDHVSKTAPNLVSGLVPKVVTLAQLTQVLKALVAEQITITDLQRILEALAGAKGRELDDLVEAARIALAPVIVQRVSNPKEALSVVTLDSGLEQIIVQNARAGGRDSGMIEPGLGRKLLESFQEQSRLFADEGKALVIVTAPILRRDLSALVRQAVPDALVLSYREIPESKRINVVAVIGATEQ
ncbi:flagellar biosynthesis protein FlhA [Rhizobiales bacterium TNE-4]|nr:flagellar biosynthesis protein FlhA [Rhizobiales bacterium TNE-4]MBV1828643.1 flagellar biosynthesis protein FlhA [Rhizobiales bacterium TNE-4]